MDKVKLDYSDGDQEYCKEYVEKHSVEEAVRTQRVLESPAEVTHVLLDLMNLVFAQDKLAVRPPVRNQVDAELARVKN